MRTEKHGAFGTAGTVRPEFLKQYEEVLSDTRIKPLSMLRNLFLSDEPYDLARFRSPKYLEALRSFIAIEDFDIIQCEGLLFTLYLDEIKRLTSAPVVLRAHNIEHHLRRMMAETSSNMLYRVYLRNLSSRLLRLETAAVRQFDAIVPISEPDARWFRSVSPATPQLLSETGAENAEYIREPEEQELRVGFIGALNWQPNLDGLKWFLKNVWPCVSRQNPRATLHIAGRGASAHVRRWLHGEGVFFEGEVGDARGFMASMNVMIAPLFAGSGLRIKIIEAMSLGRTVVATPVAAGGLAANDSQEIIIATDPSSFCSALTMVLKDPLLRAATGKAAVDFVRRNYDNRARTAELLEFYSKLTHGR
jgi:glycosyltransferase involved in cell wall biosynthesis